MPMTSSFFVFKSIKLPQRREKDFSTKKEEDMSLLTINSVTNDSLLGHNINFHLDRTEIRHFLFDFLLLI
jgi:hypothetical protein